MGKRGLKNVAYDYLLNAIMTCDLKPGQAIVEQEISDRLNISRTPIREAFKQLESEGLVRHFPSKGTFVANMTVQDVDEIFQLREMFELTALKSAITAITDSELDYVEERLRYLDDKKIEDPYVKEAFYCSDRELHSLIMKYSGNYRMIRFHKTLEVQLEQLRRISSMTPMRLSKSRQEHLDLLYTLRTRDLIQASKILSVHLQNIKESTVNVCRTMAAQTGLV